MIDDLADAFNMLVPSTLTSDIRFVTGHRLKTAVSAKQQPT